MTLRTTQRILIVLTAAVGLSAASAARADYVNNFDAAPYSTQNGTRLSAIGNDNVTGTAWTVATTNGVLGTGIDAIASTANPFGGSGGHLRLVDTNSSTNINARLNLGSVLNLTNTFTVSFKMTTTGLVAGSFAGVTFGEDSDFGGNNLWLSITPATDGAPHTVIVRYSTASLGGVADSFRAKQADGTSNFVYTDGSYFDVYARINPTTYQYESLKINGVEQIGLIVGESAVMYIPATATPAKVFRVLSGTSSVGTLDIDNVSIIPEPATLGLLLVGGMLMLSRR